MKLTTLKEELSRIASRHNVPIPRGALDLENTGTIVPNAVLTIRLSVRRRKDFLRLALISHFLPEPQSSLLRISLLEENDKLRSEDLSLCIYDTEFCLLYFSRRYSERAFFGNEKRNIENVMSKFRIVLLLPKKPKRSIRRRGYRDHGSLSPSHRWRETSDWSFDELQNLLEENREFSEACHQWNLEVLKRSKEDCREANKVDMG